MWKRSKLYYFHRSCDRLHLKMLHPLLSPSKTAGSCMIAVLFDSPNSFIYKKHTWDLRLRLCSPTFFFFSLAHYLCFHSFTFEFAVLLKERELQQQNLRYLGENAAPHAMWFFSSFIKMTSIISLYYSAACITFFLPKACVILTRTFITNEYIVGCFKML